MKAPTTTTQSVQDKFCFLWWAAISTCLNCRRSVAKLSSPLAGNLMSWSLVIQNSSTYLDFTMASSIGPTRKRSTGQSADATEMQGRIIVIVLPWPWIMRAVIDQPHLHLRIAWLINSNKGYCSIAWHISGYVSQKSNFPACIFGTPLAVRGFSLLP